MVHQIKILFKKCPNKDVSNGFKPLQTILQMICIFKITLVPVMCFLLFYTEGTKDVLRKKKKKITGKQTATTSKYKDMLQTYRSAKL